MTMADRVDSAYRLARERYLELGVDTERSMSLLATVPISLPCWQGDDVRGFESPDAPLAGGGIQATGDEPGRARSGDELRQDLEQALALIPGRHRVNLHAMYAETGGRHVDRDALAPEHFARWIGWAAERGLGLDFNATLFAHPLAVSGFTLASKAPAVRAFWIEHVRCCRVIAAEMGRRLGTTCGHNLWIPDGMKDLCVDRAGHRALLVESLDAIYGEAMDPRLVRDSVESKLFGIGSEAFVVGSHDFYLGYALTRGLVPCLDLGHYHPTESVADKISSLLPYFPALLLHVSRGLHWDSDHVAVLDDPLGDIAREIVRAEALGRVHLALDSFDACINRVGAWVIGARATQRALLAALLEPRAQLLALEEAGDYFGRLALLEAAKALPAGAVWDAFCARHGVPGELEWPDHVRRYAAEVLAGRGV
jgi:L-rhamnose isomerase